MAIGTDHALNTSDLFSGLADFDNINNKVERGTIKLPAKDLSLPWNMRQRKMPSSDTPKSTDTPIVHAIGIKQALVCKKR
jgi:hypothetical protein